MSDCQAFRDLIEEYLDGTIDDVSLERLKAHTATCQSCAEELRRNTLMQEVLADAFEPQMTEDDAAAGVMKSLADRTDELPRDIRVWIIRAKLAVAATILLAAGLIVGFAAGRTGSTSPVEIPALTVVPMRIARLEGTVLVRHEGADVWNALKSDSAVYLGDTFHSTGGSGLTLELADNKSTLELAENGMLSLKAYDSETRLFLEHGHCRASLESPHGPFFIETPHGRAEALGTEFTVTVK